MTIQEYKEKIIHTIEQMEMEHNMEVERVEIVVDRIYLGGVVESQKIKFKMVVI